MPRVETEVEEGGHHGPVVAEVATITVVVVVEVVEVVVVAEPEGRATGLL